MATTPPSAVTNFDPQIVLAKYPIPIALTYKTKLHETPSPLHRLFGLTDVFEVTPEVLRHHRHPGIRAAGPALARSRRRDRAPLPDPFAGIVERISAGGAALFPWIAGAAPHAGAGQLLLRRAWQARREAAAEDRRAHQPAQPTGSQRPPFRRRSRGRIREALAAARDCVSRPRLPGVL